MTTDSNTDTAQDKSTVIEEPSVPETLTKHEKRIQDDIALMRKAEGAVEGAAPIGLGFVLTSTLLVFHDNGLYLGYGDKGHFFSNVVLTALIVSAVMWAIVVMVEKNGTKTNRRFLVLTSGFFWLMGLLGMFIVSNSESNINGIAMAYGVFLGIAMTASLVACAKYYSTLSLPKTTGYTAMSFLLATALSSLAIFTTKDSGYYIFAIIMAVAGLFLLYRRLKGISLEKWKSEPEKRVKTGSAARLLWPLIAANALADFLVGLTWNACAGGLPHDTTVLSVAALVVFAAIATSSIAMRRTPHALKAYLCVFPLGAIICIIVAYGLGSFTQEPSIAVLGLLSVGLITIEISAWITLSAVSGIESIPASMLFGVRGVAGCVCCVLGIVIGSFIIVSNALYVGLGISLLMAVFGIIGMKIGSGVDFIKLMNDQMKDKT
jgi:hypothetical protein